MITTNIKLFTIAIFGHFRSLSYRQIAWVNPLKKFNMVTPAFKLFTSELFGLFRSLKYRETSFLNQKSPTKRNSIFDSKLVGYPLWNYGHPQTTLLGRFCFLNYRQQLFLFFLHTQKKTPNDNNFTFFFKMKG